VASKRDRDQERARLQQFLDRERGRAYVDVPVSGKLLGWRSNSRVQMVDAVVVDTGSKSKPIAWEDGQHDEFAELLAAHSATLVSLRGYSDRTVFGILVAGRELLSRAYPSHQLLRCVAMSDKPSGRDIAYSTAGIEIRFPDGIDECQTAPVAPYNRKRPKWPSFEDRLVDRYYHDACSAHGTLWQEVPVADAALGALHVPDLPGGFNWWPEHARLDGLQSVLRDHDVEVIEAKRRLNTDVIGQVIAGAILLAHEYPKHRLIGQTVVVAGRPEPALEWVCNKLGVTVVRYPNAPAAETGHADHLP
jgi:hypothetical protein